MNFIENIKERARQEIKTIVLPEAEDIRTLKATEIALKEKYAQELTQDIVEMIEGASPEEKQYLNKRITALANKIV